MSDETLLDMQRHTCSRGRLSVRGDLPNDDRATHNVKNDLHVPWKKVLHERNRPLLEGLLHPRKTQLVPSETTTGLRRTGNTV
jgi:hypothetical protein